MGKQGRKDKLRQKQLKAERSGKWVALTGRKLPLVQGRHSSTIALASPYPDHGNSKPKSHTSIERNFIESQDKQLDARLLSWCLCVWQKRRGNPNKGTTAQPRRLLHSNNVKDTLPLVQRWCQGAFALGVAHVHHEFSSFGWSENFKNYVTCLKEARS